jgi:pseudouridine synthase
MRFLQLVQRQAGISRRRAERLIKLGYVKLNGEVYKHPFAELEELEVKELWVDGNVVSLRQEELAIYKYYKPRGMVTSHEDPHHTKTVGKMLEANELIGYSIAGRLDQDAEGLLLVTNDGELLNTLTHPRYGVEKRYEVIIPRVIPFRHAKEVLTRMVKGIQHDGEWLKIVRGRPLEQGRNETSFELILTEGKKHEIKRLFRHFGFPVTNILRTSIGPIKLGKMRTRELKRINKGERRKIQEVFEEPPKKPGRPRR